VPPILASTGNVARRPSRPTGYSLPNLKPGKRAELKALGVERISAIPDDFPLSSRQKLVRDVTRSGKLFVARDLSERLNGFGPPALYLDFEAFMPAVPLYPGTRPYQALPFQWSLHRVEADGTASHSEFLAEASSDPRRAFAEALIAAVKDEELPIIVYSGYEGARLAVLATRFRDLSKPIRSIARQLADLRPVVRSGLYHPNFEFSASIKTAAPALCPDVTYDDLDQIADGTAASTAFWTMANGLVEQRHQHACAAVCLLTASVIRGRWSDCIRL